MKSMKLLLFLFSISFPFIASSQETKRVKKNHRSPYSFKEEFEVLKSDKKTKHGFYKKFVNGSLVVAGNYDQGKKIEVWQSFKKTGQIYCSYNYSTDKVIFFKQDEKQYEGLDLDNPPILSEGPLAFLVLLYSNLKYPSLAKERGVEGNVEVTLVISESGEVKDFYIEKSDNELLEEAALQAIKDIKASLQFIPARKDSKAIESFFKVPIRFRLG